MARVWVHLIEQARRDRAIGTTSREGFRANRCLPAITADVHAASGAYVAASDESSRGTLPCNTILGLFGPRHSKINRRLSVIKTSSLLIPFSRSCLSFVADHGGWKVETFDDFEKFNK